MRKFIFALALGALLLPDHGFTLGMGEIEVDSALNQELLAEIELLSATPEDVESLIVKLAPREEFARAGLDRPYLLNSLKFFAEKGDGKPYIKVTSDKPIREPFLNFLVEVDWPKGHMMREYTILLDPPVFMGQQAPAMVEDTSRPAASDAMTPAPVPAPVPAPAPQSSDSFRPATSGAAPPPTPQQTQTQTYVAPVPTQSYYQPPDGYRIQQGDTLWSLADSMRPDQSVSIEQMMLAMLRNNPEAFINENVNGLKRGYILRFPERDQMTEMSHAEAVAVVREQNALWREYQQAVAGGAPTSPMERDAEGISAGVGDISDARLEIVAAGSGVSAAGSKDPTDMSAGELRSELAITRESLESERLEKEELQTQVDSLEGQVDRMKSLLTLEDAELAGMQEAATPVEEEAMPMEGTEAVAEEIIIEEQIEIMEEEVVIEEGAVVEEEVVTEEITVSDEVVIETPVEEQVFVDEQQVDVIEEEVLVPTTSDEQFAVDPTAQPAFMQQKQGPLASILNNPVLLAASGGGLLLILLLIALMMKRRKAGGAEALVTSNLEDIAYEAEESDVLSEASEEPVEEEVAAAEPEAEEESDTESTVVLPTAEDTVVTQPEPQAEAEEPRDDIIAEADVYLAYGIYQQAEELLQNAIKDNPDNDGYRVKLAETYFAGKNTDAFTGLATEMNQRRNGEDTSAWQKIVAIGKQLTPNHELFTGAEAEMVGGLDMDDLVPHDPEPMDIDLGVDEGEAVPELDLSLDQTQVTEAPVVDDAEAEAADAEVESVEFDLDETEAVEPEQAAAEEFSLDIEASELEIEAAPETGDEAEFDLDLSDEAKSLLDSGEEQGEEGLSLDDVDAGSLDFDTGGDEGEGAEEIALEEPVLEEPAAEPATAPADEDMDLSDLDDIDEVSTKLDLAKAYLDMGDADGTRSILEEVMSEGNDTQKQEAEDLMKQLAG